MRVIFLKIFVVFVCLIGNYQQIFDARFNQSYRFFNLTFKMSNKSTSNGAVKDSQHEVNIVI